MIPVSVTRSLAIDGLVELFSMKYNNQSVYWCNDDIPYGYASYNGFTYTCVPCQFQGAEQMGDGRLPRPTLTISNITRIVKSVFGHSNLVGAQITVTTTLAKYLDDGAAPSITSCQKQTYYIDQKQLEDDSVIAYALATPLDALGVKLPKKQVLKRDFPGVIN